MGYEIKNGQWSFSLNGETFHENFDKKEDAIEEAKANLDDQESIYVGRIQEVSLSVDIDYMLENISESAYEQAGHFAEDYLEDVSDKHYRELEDAINGITLKWLYKYYNPNFWSVVDVEEIEV